MILLLSFCKVLLEGCFFTIRGQFVAGRHVAV